MTTEVKPSVKPKKIKFKFERRPSNREVEVRVVYEDNTLMDLSEQFTQLRKPGVQGHAVREAEAMGIAGAGVREQSYRTYDKDGKLLQSRQDPAIAIVGLLFQFDSVLS